MILYYLHGYVHWDPSITTLLSSHKIYSIPAVNIDGLFEIERIFNETKELEYVWKNMNFKSSKGMKCDGLYESPGVDLNWNYGYKFGFDEIGSSSDPCDE